MKCELYKKTIIAFILFLIFIKFYYIRFNWNFVKNEDVKVCASIDWDNKINLDLGDSVDRDSV